MGYESSVELTEELQTKVAELLAIGKEKYKLFEGIIWDDTGMFKMDGSKRINILDAPTQVLQMQDNGKLKRVKMPTPEEMAEMWGEDN